MSDKLSLLWHSNAPWAPTGYGQQTALFAPLLAERYRVGISAFYGLEGAPINWRGIPVLPGLGGDFGNNTLPEHAQRFFGGDKRGGTVITLCDCWPLDARPLGELNLACWCPVDHDPAPPKVVEFIVASNAVPIAMSRFGQRALGALDPLYVPHAVDCRIYRPILREAVRKESFPEGAFVVGMVGANKGHPSRKAFSQALEAFARVAHRHDNVYLYLHTALDPSIASGVNIPSLVRSLQIPENRLRMADQYTVLYAPYEPEDMAKIYSALDVLLQPSFGEGFGIPAIEAQACGVPVIVNDFTAMPEVCGAGWRLEGHHPYWSGLGSWQAVPNVDEIESALEECIALGPHQREQLSERARVHALRYDVRRVWKLYWQPALRAIERRIKGRKLVAIPSWLDERAAA